MSVVGGVAVPRPAGPLGMLPCTLCVRTCVCARVREAETGGQGQGKGLSAAHALPATAPGPLHAPRLACGISLPRGLRACSLTPAGPGSHLTSRRTPAAPSAAAPALPGPPCPLLVPQGARPLLPPVAWSRPLPGAPAPLGVCLLLSVRPQLGPQPQGHSANARGTSERCESRSVTSCPVCVLLEQTDNSAAQAEDVLAPACLRLQPRGRGLRTFR